MSRDLVEDLLAGDVRALARAITIIENREPGYRDLVSDLHGHAGGADVVGLTGSPGAGKSTLADQLAAAYREAGHSVGVVAIDPSSPFSGGAVLGDRIRMGSTETDEEVFFRSMSARGTLGGLSTATTDAVKALDAFGKDKILIETVGAGQNEVDVVRTADTVAVLVPPGSGDGVQTLKAGILEIGDVFVVNKADLDGADRTVQELRDMIEMRHGGGSVRTDHHGVVDGGTVETAATHPSAAGDGWTPPIVETIAETGEGVDDLRDALADHHEHLEREGRLEAAARDRLASEIRTLLREDAAGLVADEVEARGGIDAFVEDVIDGDADPYTVADRILAPVRECVERRRE